MLKLRNVSKFYYNNGTVASGFSKINLDLNIGEFVVITGESGSGKSTLLNVISGLDSYEEGEMYINNEETSYYSETDFEEYRKKYIGNIFQNFNLINSYTVYQNIELVYLLNHTKDKTTKDKIDDLLKKVDLYKYRNTPASKLSGGQKQRVAIARALAKETPIIVADEPTGNLDSESAKSIIKLLYEISKDKLVIIVTHNYDQVEEYVTRKIKMHDGKILEDRVVVKENYTNIYNLKEYGSITFIDKLKLSIRNTFNVIPKFLLLLVVYLFLTVSVIGEYTSNKKSDYEQSFLGYNQYFTDLRDERIIIKKKDKSPITDEENKALSKMDNIDYVVENDLLLDTEFSVTDNNIWIWGNIFDISEFSGTLDVGRMPEADNEVIVVGTKDDYYLSNPEETLLKECSIENNMNGQEMTSNKVKIVGIKYVDASLLSSGKSKIYVDKRIIDDIRKSINKSYSDVYMLLNGNNMDTTIYPSNKVPKGRVLIDEGVSFQCKNGYCINNKVNISVSNLYYEDELEVTISNTYNKNTFERLTGYKEYDRYPGYVFINEDDYYSLFNKENYQSSVFVKDVKRLESTMEVLKSNGFTTLHVKDTLVDFGESIMVFVKLFQVIGIVIILVALFFISYFIIKIILKSRNTYFSTVRILGASKKDIRMLINMELNTVLNISYILVMTFIILVSTNILDIPYIKDLVLYLKITDYMLLYIILFVISVFISNKFSKSLFKNSAMKTYREGAL